MGVIRMVAGFINGWAGTVMNIKVMRCLLMFFVAWSGMNMARAVDARSIAGFGGLNVGLGTFGAEGAFNDGTADLPKNDNWMSWLNDSVRIRDISIPGTHDSGSRFGIVGYSKNQTLTIPQQLNAGIRYLDVRLRHIDNTFTIHHGEVYQQMMFAQVLRDTAAFLKANPKEFVFMRVKEEHTPKNVTRSFDQTFEYYRKLYAGSIWKPTGYNPTLAEVRGRIVFIQDFAGWEIPPVGVRLNSFEVQDDWDFNMTNVSKKPRIITDAINQALISKSNVINNLAVSAPIYTPHDTATVINSLTLDYLNKNVLTRPLGDRYVGILPTDYPGPSLIDAIIRTNSVSCSSVYLDAKTRQLATCFGKGLASLTDAKAYAVKCDGSAQQTKDGLLCYVANTNTLKPVRLELQAACSTLASSEGRYLSCDNTFAATHTAPVIACNGLFNVASGLCTDAATKQVKPLELSCYGTPVSLPSGAVSSYGCAKPVDVAPPRRSATFDTSFQPLRSVGSRQLAFP